MLILLINSTLRAASVPAFVFFEKIKSIIYNIATEG